jgi:hypothetical protein
MLYIYSFNKNVKSKMKKLNFKNDRASFGYRVSAFCSIVMMVMCLAVMSCSNLENDLSVKPSDESLETNSTAATELNNPVSQKCLSLGQENTDRFLAYNAAYIGEDLDKLYQDFWGHNYYEFVPNFEKDREGARANMLSFYGERNGDLTSYICESKERYIYNDVVYDMGTYDNVGSMNGNQFIINGYYFLRWIKESDGVWRVDKSVAGPRGNTVEVHQTTDAGPVICNNQQQSGNTTGNEAAISQEITARFAAYSQALALGNADNASGFWAADVHLYGQGLDLDRDGLYQYYSQFFQTGSIAPHTTLRYRFVHGNVVFDIAQADDTVIVNGVQSIRKKNYVIRWVKGNDGVWRIHRIFDLLRVY